MAKTHVSLFTAGQWTLKAFRVLPVIGPLFECFLQLLERYFNTLDLTDGKYQHQKREKKFNSELKTLLKRLNSETGELYE
jgi:hypothetical protein